MDYKVVVTLTTIPSREKHVLKTIQSIKNNTLRPNVIYVNMRKRITRLNAEFSPGFRDQLIKMGVTINESEDYGSLTKIIPIIKAEADPEALVITLDDDIIYNQNFIHALVYGFKEFNENNQEPTVVGFSGITYPETSLKILGKIDYVIYQDHGIAPEILESGFGLIMKKKWLDRFPKVPIEKSNLKGDEKYLYMCDDYILSLYFDIINIKKRIIDYPLIGRKGDDFSSYCTFIEEASNNNDSLSNKTTSIENYYNGTKIIKEFLNAAFPGSNINN